MLRSGVVMFCASALFALLPAVAHAVSGSAIGYGVLLGGFGLGAVAGALVMQAARARWSTETVTFVAVAILGTTILGVAVLHNLPGLVLVMLVSGGAWITFISLANALVQSLAPDWVRARVLAIFMLITQGGIAAGSAFWGTISSRSSVEAALIWAGLSTTAMTLLGLFTKFPEHAGDVSPWNHWRMPAIVRDAAPELTQGPVLVTVEYHVKPDEVRPFLQAMERYGRVRRRDGASRWGIFRDVERPDVYLETFIVTSWAEHLRQHERLTRADSELEEQINRHTRGEAVVRHLIYPEP
jgi:MFS family permease